MSFRLTPEERRIIERTKREGEEFHASQTPAQKKERIVKSVLAWVFGIVFLAALAMLLLYLGTLI